MRAVALWLLQLAGAGLVVAGVWWIYPPAALVVAGFVLVGLALALEVGER